MELNLTQLLVQGIRFASEKPELLMAADIIEEHGGEAVERVLVGVAEEWLADLKGTLADVRLRTLSPRMNIECQKARVKLLEISASGLRIEFIGVAAEHIEETAMEVSENSNEPPPALSSESDIPF